MTKSIPREFIQQVLNRIDIVDLIDGRVPLKKKSGSNYFACCPFHSEKSASFSVSQNKQFYHCFGCGAHGNAIDFLMQHQRLNFPEAIEALAKQLGIEVPRTSQQTQKAANTTNLYELLDQVTHYYQQNLKNNAPAIEYLKKRGLTGEIVKEFEVGYALPGWEHLLQTIGITPPIK